MEAFDETLDRNIWSLSDKRLKWDLEIATKRRNKPEEVEASLDDLFQKQRSAETAEMDAVSDGDGAEQDETDRESILSSDTCRNKDRACRTGGKISQDPRGR